MELPWYIVVPATILLWGSVVSLIVASVGGLYILVVKTRA